nr:hypothetical protein [uncultured Rhodopila sp.]
MTTATLKSRFGREIHLGFSPDEARDEHGRWTSEGARETAMNEHYRQSDEHSEKAFQAEKAGKIAEATRQRRLSAEHRDTARRIRNEPVAPAGESGPASGAKSSGARRPQSKQDRERVEQANRHANSAEYETHAGNHRDAARHYGWAAGEHQTAAAEAETSGDTERAERHKAKAAVYTKKSAASSRLDQEKRASEREGQRKAYEDYQRRQNQSGPSGTAKDRYDQHMADSEMHSRAGNAAESAGNHNEAADHFEAYRASQLKAYDAAMEMGDARVARYARDNAERAKRRIEENRQKGQQRSSRTASPNPAAGGEGPLKTLGLDKMPSSLGELKRAYFKKVKDIQESFRADASPEQQAVAAKVIKAHEELQNRLKASGVTLSRTADEWVEFVKGGVAYRTPQSAVDAIKAPAFRSCFARSLQS